MKENLDNHKDILIKKAKEDFESAENLVKFQNFSEEIALFHCQQAVEKAIKAYLDSKGITYPKSHDIEMLISLCAELDNSFMEISFIAGLTAYAVEIRYDEIIDMPLEEVKNWIAQTKTALNFIFHKI